MNNDNTVEVITGKIKWYNQDKGFGFIISPDIDRDIFLHFSSLDKAGFKNIDTNDQVVCEISYGPHGLQVIKILEIKFAEKEKWIPPAFLGRGDVYNPDIIEMSGEVKWFNPMKGFGFILPDDNGLDIFFHACILNGAGYDFIDPGVRVAIKVVNTKKGREAREMVILG